MGIKYLAFDVETPNRMNDKISSLGVTFIDECGDIKTIGSLINPECCFDRFNVDLTGISPVDVEKAPKFPEIWEKLEPLFKNCTIVAHNALFDLSVLQKTLSAYSLSAPVVDYVCTMTMAKELQLDIQNYRLNTLCEHYGIQLNHHNAESDSRACACLLKELLYAGVDVRNHIKKYDLSESSSARDEFFAHKRVSLTTQTLKELASILKAISCDGMLAKEEIDYLTKWLKENDSLRGNFPYDRIANKLEEVLEDGIITNDESKELLQLFQKAEDPLSCTTTGNSAIDVRDKNICLSGEFTFGSKEDVAGFLEEKGAQIQKSITKKTNILIVGGMGSSAWCAGNYGTKVKKALELQEKGIEIQILSEKDFFKSCEG